MALNDPSCPLCGFKKFDTLYENIRHSDGSSIIRCLNCTLVFQHPLMSEAAEREFYEKQFPEYMKNRGAAGETEPEKHYNVNQGEAVRRLSYVGKYIGPGHDVLELGSSTGYFIGRIKDMVRSVTGVEPGDQYRNFANGAGIRTYPSLGDVRGMKFDLIFSFYVFEHLRNPVEFLNDLRCFLKTGGTVVFEVPNVEDALVSFYAIPELFDFYWQVAHYFYYSARTLREVFEKGGFKAADMIHSQRYDISNHLHWLKEKKPGGMGKYSDIFDERTNEAYKECLVRKGISDTITIVAKLNER